MKLYVCFVPPKGHRSKFVFYSVLTPLAPSLTILKPHKQNWLQTHLGKLQTRKLSVAGVTIKSIGNPTDQ